MLIVFWFFLTIAAFCMVAGIVRCVVKKSLLGLFPNPLDLIIIGVISALFASGIYISLPSEESPPNMIQKPGDTG